jgi:hypothetical protein
MSDASKRNLRPGVTGETTAARHAPVGSREDQLANDLFGGLEDSEGDSGDKVHVKKPSHHKIAQVPAAQEHHKEDSNRKFENYFRGQGGEPPVITLPKHEKNLYEWGRTTIPFGKAHYGKCFREVVLDESYVKFMYTSLVGGALSDWDGAKKDFIRFAAAFLGDAGLRYSCFDDRAGKRIITKKDLPAEIEATYGARSSTSAPSRSSTPGSSGYVTAPKKTVQKKIAITATESENDTE